MSADLSVKLKKKIEVSIMLSDAKYELKALLCIDKVPQLTLVQLEKGKRIEISTDNIGAHGEVYLIGAKEKEDEVGLIFINDPETDGIDLGISVGTTKSPFELALAAAVAIAIAKQQNSDVIDDGCIWSDVYQQEPVAFKESISLKEMYNDVDLASYKFFKGLYMFSKYI